MASGCCTRLTTRSRWPSRSPPRKVGYTHYGATHYGSTYLAKPTLTLTPTLTRRPPSHCHGRVTLHPSHLGLPYRRAPRLLKAAAWQRYSSAAPASSDGYTGRWAAPRTQEGRPSRTAQTSRAAAAQAPYAGGLWRHRARCPTTQVGAVVHVTWLSPPGALLQAQGRRGNKLHKLRIAPRRLPLRLLHGRLRPRHHAARDRPLPQEAGCAHSK